MVSRATASQVSSCDLVVGRAGPAVRGRGVAEHAADAGGETRHVGRVNRDARLAGADEVGETAGGGRDHRDTGGGALQRDDAERLVPRAGITSASAVCSCATSSSWSRWPVKSTARSTRCSRATLAQPGGLRAVARDRQRGAGVRSPDPRRGRRSGPARPSRIRAGRRTAGAAGPDLAAIRARSSVRPQRGVDSVADHVHLRDTRPEQAVRPRRRIDREQVIERVGLVGQPPLDASAPVGCTGPRDPAAVPAASVAWMVATSGTSKTSARPDRGVRDEPVVGVHHVGHPDADRPGAVRRPRRVVEPASRSRPAASRAPWPASTASCPCRSRSAGGSSAAAITRTPSTHESVVGWLAGRSRWAGGRAPPRRAPIAAAAVPGGGRAGRARRRRRAGTPTRPSGRASSEIPVRAARAGAARRGRGTGRRRRRQARARDGRRGASSPRSAASAISRSACACL